MIFNSGNIIISMLALVPGLCLFSFFTNSRIVSIFDIFTTYKTSCIPIVLALKQQFNYDAFVADNGFI